MGNALDWNWETAFGGANWQDRFGIGGKGSSTPFLDWMNHYLKVGTDYEGSGQLTKVFHNTERWYKEDVLENWNKNIGGENWQYRMGLKDRPKDEKAQYKDPEGSSIIEGISLDQEEDKTPPSATDSRAHGWHENIRRSLGEVGEDLYASRGKRASILTRRGMLA